MENWKNVLWKYVKSNGNVYEGEFVNDNLMEKENKQWKMKVIMMEIG